MLWNEELEDLLRGYTEMTDAYRCVICNKQYEKGRIYEFEGALYDAMGAAKYHFRKEHKSLAAYLLHQESSLIGLSEIQANLLQLILEGKSDKEISKQLGIAHSTVRNHRFKLREKEKQGRLFLAMMDMISKGSNRKLTKLDKEELCDAHKTATTIDDRYNITDKEREDVIKNYFYENGALKSYPAKEKKKVIVLSQIVKNFASGKKYSEKEINRILKRIHEDYVTIRRAMIEYGFLERSNDCSSYWVKE